MENLLSQYGGIIGGLVLVVLLLVKEVIGSKRNGNGISKDFCNERSRHMASSIQDLKEYVNVRISELGTKIDDLPRKLNGGGS